MAITTKAEALAACGVVEGDHFTAEQVAAYKVYRHAGGPGAHYFDENLVREFNPSAEGDVHYYVTEQDVTDPAVEVLS